MTDCEHRDATLAYFDGALDPSREPSVLEHLASCASCQDALGDAVAIDAVLSKASAANPVRSTARRRWPWLAALAGGIAAAAAVLFVALPRRESPTRLAIELPHERALEARFTGTLFAPHRPYGVLRGDRAIESIALADLAALEQRGDRADLIAALAATGNVQRAQEVAVALPDGASADADRAALALAAGDSERALDDAYAATARDPRLGAGWWNLGLAARASGQVRVARGAFEHVAELGEPGWADEARAQIAELDRTLAPELEFDAFRQRAQAMIDGGPVIAVADVHRFPAFARVYVLEALRLASGPRVEELRPLARELDDLSGVATVMPALDRAAAADPVLRARFAARYRPVLDRTASADEVAKLIVDLARAGHAVDDIRAGAIILGNQVELHLDELKAIAAGDPWNELVEERVRIKHEYPAGDPRAVAKLTALLDVCTNNAWSMRCGQVAQELARQLFASGRAKEAESWNARALDWYRRGVALPYIYPARALLGDIHRNLDRTGLARAELEEVMLATRVTNCRLRRYSAIALAYLALDRRDWAATRATLPSPVAEQGCETSFEIQALGTAVDLARATGNADDLTRARAWIDASAGFADPNRDAIALVGRVRLGGDRDPAAVSQLRAWLADHAPDANAPWPTAIRSWGFQTLLADAGARGDYSRVLELAAAEYANATRSRCALVVSLDDTSLTIAARTPTGVVGDQRTIVPRELASLAIVPRPIVDALARCDGIAVAARPPLHGRADLLPPELPWWFAGDVTSPSASVGPRMAVEVTSPQPPDSSLPALPDPGPSRVGFDRSLSGADATPSNVLAALAQATYIELHAHGIVSLADDDAAFLALSPDRDGTYTLRARDLRNAKLAHAPVVVLAACRAATVAPSYATRWSLPDALLFAGARAVVGVDIPVPDAGARAVFDELHRRLDAGEPVHAALAAIRAAAPPGAWQRRLMLFR